MARHLLYNQDMNMTRKAKPLTVATVNNAAVLALLETAPGASMRETPHGWMEVPADLATTPDVHTIDDRRARFRTLAEVTEAVDAAYTLTISTTPIAEGSLPAADVVWETTLLRLSEVDSWGAMVPDPKEPGCFRVWIRLRDGRLLAGSGRQAKFTAIANWLHGL